jgi:hypothetical protein
MLQTLSDLFLLISNDSIKITNKDITIFYNFITRKMPQIEQQCPNVLSKSLKSFSNYGSPENKNKRHICLNEFKNDKNSIQLFVNFQKKLINLFNDLIDYCYNVGIIKLDSKYKKLIKTKIDEKIREKSAKKCKKNISHFEYNYNKLYRNELVINKSKKEELRNMLIFYIINGDINFNIYPNEYINFFNSMNKTNNLLTAEQFMKYIKNIKIIYKEMKKNNYNKIISKSINNNTDIKNKTNGTNNSGIKSFNTERKLINMSHSNNNRFDKNSYKKKIYIKKNANCSIDQYKNKFKSSSNNKSSINKFLKINKIQKEINSLSPDEIIFNDNNDKYDSDDNDDNEINDTIRCETPKNIGDKIELNENFNLQKLLLKDGQNKDKNETNKKGNKSYNRLTITGIINKEESTIISNPKNEKENFFKSFLEEKNFFNINQKKNENESNKQINESQKINNKKKYDIINKESKSEKKLNKFKDETFDNIINKKNDMYNNTDNKNYHLVNIKTDKNNHKYKELYLYKDLEMHQHLVIYNEEKEKKENENEDESDNIGCNII